MGEFEVIDRSDCGPVEDVTVAVERGRERKRGKEVGSRERENKKLICTPSKRGNTHYNTLYSTHTYRTHQVE